MCNISAILENVSVFVHADHLVFPAVPAIKVSLQNPAAFSRAFQAQLLQVGVDHDLDQFVEMHSGLPAQGRGGFLRVA